MTRRDSHMCALRKFRTDSTERTVRPRTLRLLTVSLLFALAINPVLGHTDHNEIFVQNSYSIGLG